MKKVFIIILIFIVGCKAKQQSLDNHKSFKPDNYQSLHTFNGDTLKYVQVNFIDNKANYIHQPLSKLTDVCEIPFKGYIAGDDFHDVKSVPFMYLNMYNYSNQQLRIKNKKNPNIIVISWEKPLQMDTVVKLIRTDHGNWKGASKVYFEKQIIKNIELVKYKF
jgi:hypothetical protein